MIEFTDLINEKVRYGNSIVIKKLVIASVVMVLCLVARQCSAADTVNNSMGTITTVLTLQDCLMFAVKHHPSLKTSKGNIEIYTNRYNKAVADYLPDFSLSSGYSRAGGVEKKDSESYSAGLNASQLVYDFGRVPALIEIAKLNLELQKLDMLNTQQNLEVNVTQAYYSCLLAQQALKLQEKNVVQMEQYLGRARALFEVGNRPKYDVTKAEVNLSNAKLNFIKARNKLRLANITLNNAIGKTKQNESYVVDDNINFEIQEVKDIEKLKSAALKKRVDWLSSKIREKIAVINLGNSVRAFLPTLNASGGYRWSGSEFPLNETWSLGLSLNMSIFTGFSKINAYRESETNLKNVRTSQETLIQTIILDIEQDYAVLEEAVERIRATEGIVKQAKEALELADARYFNGVGSIIELTDAQVSLFSVENSYIQAVCDYYTAKVNLEKSSGEMEYKK
ncbi:MAG: TolC family protein [Elusimicrobiota bacterium]